MRGALAEGNIHLLKFCWIQEKREEASSWGTNRWIFGGYRQRHGKGLLSKIHLTGSTGKSLNCPFFPSCDIPEE